MDIQFATGTSSLGNVLVAATPAGLCAILLGDDPKSLVDDLTFRFRNARIVPAAQSFNATVTAVLALVETPRLGLDLPLDMRGTEFQHRVWTALQSIPSGQTVSYAQLAQRMGAPTASRAVAAACAANPLAIAIPCHRVVRGDGRLSGYRWGVARKKALLDREKP